VVATRRIPGTGSARSPRFGLLQRERRVALWFFTFSTWLGTGVYLEELFRAPELRGEKSLYELARIRRGRCGASSELLTGTPSIILRSLGAR